MRSAWVHLLHQTGRVVITLVIQPKVRSLANGQCWYLKEYGIKGYLNGWSCHKCSTPVTGNAFQGVSHFGLGATPISNTVRPGEDSSCWSYWDSSFDRWSQWEKCNTLYARQIKRVRRPGRLLLGPSAPNPILSARLSGRRRPTSLPEPTSDRPDRCPPVSLWSVRRQMCASAQRRRHLHHVTNPSRWLWVEGQRVD